MFNRDFTTNVETSLSIPIAILKSFPPTSTPFYLRYTAWKNRQNKSYNWDPDPFKIIKIDPRRIGYCSGNMPKKVSNIGLIEPGDWDSLNKPFEETIPQYQMFKKRYKWGEEWNDINEVKEIKRKVEEEDYVWNGCRSASSVDNRLAENDKLYDAICKYGYKSQAELVTDQSIEDPIRLSLDRSLRRSWIELDEIAVDIGRNGDFLFVDTRHRASLAKIIGIDEVPVRIVARHKKWVQFGEKIWAYSDKKHLRYEFPHPDLKEVPHKYSIKGHITEVLSNIELGKPSNQTIVELFPGITSPFAYELANKGYDARSIQPKDEERSILAQYHTADVDQEVDIDNVNVAFVHYFTDIDYNKYLGLISELKNSGATIVVTGNQESSDFEKLASEYDPIFIDKKLGTYVIR